MINFNPHYNPYPSRRSLVYAKNGLVATSQPFAAQAGLEMLQAGGNAIDAALAAAIALTVVEPTSNGIGSDAFALIWAGDKLHGLNASGPSPRSISIDKVVQAGHEKIPAWGWLPVTVPGAVAGWAAASERFGRLPFPRLFEPAHRYAEEGYPLSPVLARNWARAYQIYSEKLKNEEFKEWFSTFAPGGRAPNPGEIWSSKNMADTLGAIAETNGKSFYQGSLAEKIVAAAQEYGGFLTQEDLENYKAQWVQPLGMEYGRYKVWEIPPNGQGLAALMALGILTKFSSEGGPPEEFYHREIEALKLALTDGMAQITDPEEMKVSPEKLLSPEYLEERARLIGKRALTPEPGQPPSGGTVYLAAADGEGNMVSFIQSNFMGFGSGVVVPGTGISMQNRGFSFQMDPKHPNALAGGKKTYHTIIPGFLTRDDNAVGPFGVMGGYMQTQGHLQVIRKMIDQNLSPQAALDAPRWQWLEGRKVAVEKSFPEHIASSLSDRGHQIDVRLESGSFGRGQIILRERNGVLVGGTEPRTDSHIASF